MIRTILKTACVTASAVSVLFFSGCYSGTSPENTTGFTDTEAAYQTEEDDPGVSYVLPRVIKQRETSFGDNGCGGAAGLMALQAAGYLKDIDTDQEYTDFWNTVPRSDNATKGWNGNGIWNPAYSEWLSQFANAERIKGFVSSDLKAYLSDGYVAVVLVSLGETGDTTHWMAVTGWKIKDGLMLYDVADPWSGMVHEFTGPRLQKRLEEGAKRKGDYGEGYETDGVIIGVSK